MIKVHLALAATALVTSAAASGQTVDEAPICSDRPAKANATCTVPPGALQLETGITSWSLNETGGTRTTTTTFSGTTIKLGLTSRSDLQVGVVPIVGIRTKVSGTIDRASGFGDVTVRYKHRLTPSDSRIQVGLIPFVKLPTAKRGIGNGEVEGGVAVPILVSTDTPYSIVFGPEVDLLADGDGAGHHLQLVNLVNVSRPLSPRLTVVGELWAATNFDPAGRTTAASADAALALALSRTLQVDLGANFGLTGPAPRVEVYAGASVRF